MKKKHILNLALFSASGDVTAIPQSVHDSAQDANVEAAKLKKRLDELLECGVIVFMDDKGGATPIMDLGQFVTEVLRMKGLRAVICDVDYNDGAPDLLLPKPSGNIIIPR